MFGGLLLRLSEFRGGGRGSDVLMAIDEALSVWLAGGNPYDHTYTQTRPPGSPMPYPPVQLLIHLPGRVLGGFDGLGFTEPAAAGAILVVFAVLAARFGWLVGLPALALLAGLPNLVVIPLDGSNDSSTALVALLAVLAAARAADHRLARRTVVGAGMLAGAALATKQSTLFVVVPILAYVWWTGGRSAAVRYLSGGGIVLLGVSVPFLLADPLGYLGALASFAGFHTDIYGWNVWTLATGLGWSVPDLRTMTLLNVAATLAVLLLVTGRPLRTVWRAVLAGLTVTLVLFATSSWTTYAYFALVAPLALAVPLLYVWEAERSERTPPDERAGTP